MATKKVTANTTAQTITSAEKHNKCKITAINVDNQYSSAIKLTLQDIFTPDASHGVSSPTEKTITRWVRTIGNGAAYSADQNELADLVCLGTVKMVASATSTDCIIVVNYHWE